MWIFVALRDVPDWLAEILMNWNILDLAPSSLVASRLTDALEQRSDFVATVLVQIFSSPRNC
jgi:hypothetical protein